MKEYFRHDYDAAEDEKIVRILKAMGPEGYGIYWLIIEKLYKHGGEILFDPDTMAWEMRAQCDRIATVMQSDLFYKTDAGMLRSHSVNRRLEEREGRTEQAKTAAKFRWNKKGSMRPHSKRSATAMLGEDRIGEDKREEKKTSLARPAHKDSQFQEFMNWYIHDVLKIDRANKDAIDAAYRRFGKAARDVMAFACKDVAKAILGTQEIAGWAERKNLSWNLDTIAKRMPDWMACPSEFAEEKSKW